jgi:hypothetical protein
MGRSNRCRRALFVALAAIATLAVACNAIIGIDDFRRTECGIGPCGDLPDGGPDQIVPDRIDPDAGGDTGADAPPGVGPVSWAQFPMPNYQSTVDAGTGVRPIDSGIIDDDVLEDKVTGLVWRRAVIGAAPGQDFFYPAAQGECQKLPNGPWRLPKRIELVTLLSYGHAAPFIDQAAFTGVAKVRVWTSSEVRPVDGRYWVISFDTGALEQLNGGDNKDFAKVLCVKDKQ